MSSKITDFISVGITADRPASPDIAAGDYAVYYATDDEIISWWDGAAWQEFTGGGGGNTTDPKSAIYPPFTTGANDDEFDNGSFSGWTLVNSGSHNPTITEANDCASLLHPGSDSAAELHAYLKTVTPATGDYIETCARFRGINQNYPIGGLIMADGGSYGAGLQLLFDYSPTENKWRIVKHANFSSFTSGSFITVNPDTFSADIFLRLKYVSANTFTGYVSADGVSWIDVTGGFSYTFSPTRIGFYVSTWGGAQPYNFSFRYFKHSS